MNGNQKNRDEKFIIYDFDGVILDSVNVKTLAFKKLFENFGDDIVYKVIDHHKNNGGVSRFEKIRFYYEQFIQLEITENQLHKIANQFSELVLQQVLNSPYIPGALEFIQQQRHTHYQFICTGTPQNEIDIICNELNISSFFRGIYGSPTDKISIIREILDNYSLDTTNGIYFGDSITDLKAAEHFNIHFVGINYFGDSDNDIEKYNSFEVYGM